MRKFNKTAGPDAALQELLISLKLQDDPSAESESLECSNEIAQMFECSESEDTSKANICENSIDLQRLENGRRYKISKGPSPFSLFNITAGHSGTKKASMATTANQKFVIPKMNEYNLTEEDLRKYRTKKKRRIRKTCSNWDDITEASNNEPERIGFRFLALKYKKS